MADGPRLISAYGLPFTGRHQRVVAVDDGEGTTSLLDDRLNTLFAELALEFTTFSPNERKACADFMRRLREAEKPSSIIITPAFTDLGAIRGHTLPTKRPRR